MNENRIYNNSKLDHKVKKLSILLRVADLLDMTRKRVFEVAYLNNMKLFSDESNFHWLSHLLTINNDEYTIYEFNKPTAKVLEKIHLQIEVNSIGDKIVKSEFPNWFDIDYQNDEIVLTSNNRNFKCSFIDIPIQLKWLYRKHEWLFKEIYHLNRYININNKLFQTSIILRIRLVKDVSKIEYIDDLLDLI